MFSHTRVLLGPATLLQQRDGPFHFVGGFRNGKIAAFLLSAYRMLQRLSGGPIPHPTKARRDVNSGGPGPIATYPIIVTIVAVTKN